MTVSCNFAKTFISRYFWAYTYLFSKSKTTDFLRVSILPLLLLLLITPLSSSLSLSDTTNIVTKESLDRICSQPTIYHHFCIIWLTNDPITFTIRFKGLLELVIQKTQLFGYKNIAMIKDLVKTTTDPKLKISYGWCVTYYELAIKSIEDAIRFASSNEYELTSQAAMRAFSSITTCEADLAGRNNVPSDVTLRNMRFKRMCNIGTVFSDVYRF
ncbi:PREDICTED: pectinesterase inhibitor 2-like [Camelina sativa]|uniref:Pectinesterase inhibitor 2-like n=1 Tax=Camelina sativa TaxID=90675 RepID=A0ABM1QZP8_CAMSA|nr:PREDICTED: pectinesterase inhibitor 2-like [Camelina sativa]